MTTILEDWLRTLRTRVDPDERFFHLHASASAEEVEGWRSALKQRLSIDLPESWSDLYLRFNGEREVSAGLFFGLSLLSLQDHLSIYASQRADAPYDRPSASSNPPEAIKFAWFNERWLPFAHDSGGSYLALDFDPGPAGSPGQVITMGSGESTQSVVAQSFDVFLLDLTGLLEAGNFLLSKGKLQLKDPPLKHFLDRHDPVLVEQSRRLAAHPHPELRAELIPQSPMSINLNEGGFGSPPPDLRRVERLVISTKPGEIWEEWRFEDRTTMSSKKPNVEPARIEATFQGTVEAWKAKGFSLTKSDP